MRIYFQDMYFLYSVPEYVGFIAWKA